MNRREFLAQVAAWSAGTAAAVPLFRIVPAEVQAQTVKQPLLAWATGKDYEALTKQVLAPLGGMKAFVKPGDRVVIKPNIGWDNPPELAANTHPLVVVGLIKLALEAGAKEIKVFDRPCNSAPRTYTNSGIQPAINALGDNRVTCSFIDDRLFVPVDIQKGQAVTQWPLYKPALEADCYINVPIAKHHGLTKLTLGLKNVMGVIGGNRGQIHQNAPQKLADLNTVIRPKLTVIDATRILLRHGPKGGNPEDVKVLDTLVASADPVAADAYATTLFGMKPQDIAPTVVAAQMGLGEIDLDKVKVVQA